MSGHGYWLHRLARLNFVSLLAQWLARGSRRDRVAAKFVENEFEKVDRLMELYGRYGARVMAEERRLGTSDESYDDEEVLLARMDAGLYTLQQVRALTWVCTLTDRSKRSMQKFALSLGEFALLHPCGATHVLACTILLHVHQIHAATRASRPLLECPSAQSVGLL